jgi:hypothetical protein
MEPVFLRWWAAAWKVVLYGDEQQFNDGISTMEHLRTARRAGKSNKDAFAGRVARVH